MRPRIRNHKRVNVHNWRPVDIRPLVESRWVYEVLESDWVRIDARVMRRSAVCPDLASINDNKHRLEAFKAYYNGR